MVTEIEDSLPKYSLEEVASHNSVESTWIILEGKVYDVTKFLEDHPGGDEVILAHAGQDATESFEDVGHSADARELAGEYLIGSLSNYENKPGVITESDFPEMKVEETKKGKETWRDILTSSTWTNFLIPVAISIGVYITFRIAQSLFSKKHQ